MKSQKHIIKSNANLNEIWRKLFIERIAFLLVVDDNFKFIGVLGKEDMESQNLPQGFESLNAYQLCNKNCSFIQDSKDSYNKFGKLLYYSNETNLHLGCRALWCFDCA